MQNWLAVLTRVDEAIVVQTSKSFQNASTDLLNLDSSQSPVFGGVQCIVVETFEDKDRIVRLISPFVEQRSNVRCALLKAKKNVSFVAYTPVVRILHDDFPLTLCVPRTTFAAPL
jgi:hypothetical protein